MILDKLFVNGLFYNKDNSNITSIGVKDGIIKYISNSKNNDTRMAKEVINLEGQHVYPGFIDTHIHLLAYSWNKIYNVDLSNTKSLEEVVLKVKDFIDNNIIKPGDWVVGSGWNQEEFDNKKLLDRELLDEISIKHPILLYRACFHICAVNSLALELANITAKTDSVNGGSIDVDSNGIPTGILRENAIELITSIKPKISDKNFMKELIIKACKDLKDVGITTVHSDDFDFVEDKKALFEAYKELSIEGKLPIKIVLQLRVAKATDIYIYKELGLQSWKYINNLLIGPIKIIADGSLGSKTAALSKAYEDDKDNEGVMLLSTEKLDELIKEVATLDFDIAIHAIGDKAMSIVLDLYEKYMSIFNNNECRPSIIHCQIASKEILERFKKLNVIANIQPVFLNTDWKSAEDRVGHERLKFSYCWKKYIDKGIVCVGSSDAPIESFNPIYGIYSAVTRKDFKGKPSDGWIIKESLSVSEAIGLFTGNAAYASKEEKKKGSLDIGKYADFVVLSEDIYKASPNNIKNITVERTFVNGEEITSRKKVFI